MSTVRSDWPESLWVCPIPDDVIAKVNAAGGETAIKVKCGKLEETVMVRKGKRWRDTGLFPTSLLT